MKKFRDLLNVDRPKPTETVSRASRAISFQSLADRKQSLPFGNSFKSKLDAIQLRQPQKQHPSSPIRPNARVAPIVLPQEGWIKEVPASKIRRNNLQALHQQQQPRIEGVPVATSLTVSIESVNPTNKENVDSNLPQPQRLNTEECEEISEKLTSIKEALMKGVLDKTRNGSDMNSVLSDMRKQLDLKTQLVVDEVMTKRRNKEVYGRAREDVKTYFSKKKEEREGYKREKTLETPYFEEPSNRKQSSGKAAQQATFESKKSAESTGHKLTVIRKSSGKHMSFKEAITVRRKPVDDVRVQQFTLE